MLREEDGEQRKYEYGAVSDYLFYIGTTSQGFFDVLYH